jgi:hypothetical protein
VKDRKDELTAWAGERTQKARLEAVGRPSNNQAVAEHWEVTEEKATLGAEVNQMPKRMTGEQAIMIRLAA